MENNLQRTEEWFEMRLGRLTASTISKLTGIKGLGLTGESLAFEKAVEIVFGRDPEWNVETWDMRRGTEQEEKAFDLFQRLNAIRFEVQKAEFFPLGENSGASPDGLAGKDAVLEIKCPRPEKFFKIVKDGIEAIDKEWLDQMQHEMRCTNSVKCYFFIYIQWKGKELHHTIEIPFDKERSDFILERIEKAVVIRDNFVQELRDNIQFKWS